MLSDSNITTVLGLPQRSSCAWAAGDCKRRGFASATVLGFLPGLKKKPWPALNDMDCMAVMPQPSANRSVWGLLYRDHSTNGYGGAAPASPGSVFFSTQRLGLGVGGESPRRHTCTPGPDAHSATAPQSHTHISHTSRTPHSDSHQPTAAARERGGEGLVGEGGVGQTGAWPGPRARDLKR